MPKKPKKSPLITILNSLNIGQLKDMHKFLSMSSSGLTTADKDILKELVQLVRKNKNLSDEQYWSQVLKEDDPKSSNRIKSRIFKAVENYLCLLEMQNDKSIKSHLLTSFYFNNSLIDNLTGALNKTLKSPTSSKSANINDNIVRFWLYEKNVLLTKDIRKENEHLDAMEEELSEFYVLNKMKIICEKVNRLNILNPKKQLQAYKIEINTLKDKTNSPYADIYYQLFQLIGMKDSSSFERLNQIIEDKNSHLPKSTQKEIYIYMMNFCVGKINKGNFEFAEHFFRYTKIIDKKDMILESNIISIGRFKNVLSICYILNEIDWAAYFIEKYSSALQVSKTIQRQDFLSLNQAMMFLWRKEYDPCKDCIREFQSSSMYYKDVYYKITSDKLLLKAYFETDELEALQNKIPVLIGYLRNRKKLSAERKEPNIKFLQTLDKVAANKKIELKSLKGKITVTDYVWLERILKKGDKMPPPEN